MPVPHRSASHAQTLAAYERQLVARPVQLAEHIVRNKVLAARRHGHNTDLRRAHFLGGETRNTLVAAEWKQLPPGATAVLPPRSLGPRDPSGRRPLTTGSLAGRPKFAASAPVPEVEDNRPASLARPASVSASRAAARSDASSAFSGLPGSGVPPPNMSWAPRFEAKNRRAIPVVEGPWKREFQTGWR